MIHHCAQFGDKGVEMLRQLRDLVSPVGIEATGEITFTTGNIGHRLHSILQRPYDAAGNQCDQRCHDDGYPQAHPAGLPYLAPKLGLHVIDVHA